MPRIFLFFEYITDEKLLPLLKEMCQQIALKIRDPVAIIDVTPNLNKKHPKQIITIVSTCNNKLIGLHVPDVLEQYFIPCKKRALFRNYGVDYHINHMQDVEEYLESPSHHLIIR